MSELKEYLTTNKGRRSTRGHVRRTKQSLPWWIVVVVGIIGIIGMWGLAQIFLPGVKETELSDYHNRTWLSSENWTATQPNRTQVEALIERLQENKIDMIYVEAGTWVLNGTYVEHNFAKEFRDMVREIDPDMQVLVWTWVNQELYVQSQSRISLVSFSEQAMRDWGYDGVHLRSLDAYDENGSYVQLVRSLDTVTDDQDGILSITVPPDQRPADPEVPAGLGNPTTSWSPRYKQQMALIVDEMVIMPYDYDSGIEDRDDYRAWFAYQVKIYAQDVRSINEDVDIIIALATEEHDSDVENLGNTLKAAQDGVSQAGSDRAVIHGAGLYTYNSTTSQDWVLFYDEWVKK